MHFIHSCFQFGANLNKDIVPSILYYGLNLKILRSKRFRPELILKILNLNFKLLVVHEMQMPCSGLSIQNLGYGLFCLALYCAQGAKNKNPQFNCKVASISLICKEIVYLDAHYSERQGLMGKH